MRCDRNSFWHSLFDGGGVPPDYIMVDRPDMISFLFGRYLKRESCTNSQKGRSVSIHPDELLMQELRTRQSTAIGRAQLRQRTKVEHALAHIGHWQGNRARYIGLRKNLFSLRRVAVVHNLHVIARMDQVLLS